jgi:hypothetical protein
LGIYLGILFGHFKDQFVVNLQNHLDRQIFFLDSLLDTNHGYFD